MTFEPIRSITYVSDDELRTLNMLLERLDKKTPRNILRSSYYDGKRAIRQVGTIIPPQYYTLGIVLGWSAKAVDILARRCNLDTFVWPDGDLDSLGFDEVWDENMLGSEVDQAIVSSLIHATAFVVNTRGEPGEPDSLIHFKDALNATGEWNRRARRLENLVSVNKWADRRRPTDLVFYLDGVTISASKDASGKWEGVRSEHPWGVPAEVLPYKPRLNRPFGSSRISRPVMSLHDQALRTVIRMEAHSDIYAIPDLWMFGADESIFKNADGTQKASWQVMMGRLKGIPDRDTDDERGDALDRAEVKSIPASSPQPHIDALKQQAMLFSGETSIPLTSLGVSDMTNPTSEGSYIASREDLIAEAEGATDDWSPGLRRAMTRALAIKNGLTEIPAEWTSIDTKFRKPQYLSRAAEADAGSKQLGAVDWLKETDVGLELLGLDAQQIERALAQRRRLQGSGVLQQIRDAANRVTSGDNAAASA